MAYHACISDGRNQRLTGATIPPRRLFMVPLIAAAVLGVSQPAAYAEFEPPGPDTFCATAAVSDLCDQLRFPSNFAFSMPGMPADPFVFMPDGVFVTSSEETRLSGVIVAQSDSTVQFSVEIDMSGPETPAPTPLIQGLQATCYSDPGDPINWTAFKTWSGELVGLPGSIVDGARYTITKRSNIQFGIAANDRNLRLGMAGEFVFELANPPQDPNLPVAPLDGFFTINTLPAVTILGIDPSCFPPAEPNLTGTWTGTIDCVGFDAEASFSAKPVEQFFPLATLEIGRSATNLLDVGDQYSVRLTRETGNEQSFCAYAPNNPGSTTGGQGVLVEPQRQATRVHFKFEGERLKARELIADGLHGTQLCKWSFTRTSTTPPTVTDACSPSEELGCVVGKPPNEQCDDNAVCGQGPACDGTTTFTCTCKDGFVGVGVNGSCTPAP